MGDKTPSISATQTPSPALSGAGNSAATAKQLDQVIKVRLGPFFERRNPGKGLIPRERLFNALTDVMAGIIPLRISDPDKLQPSSLLADRQLADDFDHLLMALRGKVWKGTVKDGRPEVTSPPSSPEFRRNVIVSALVRYIADYRPVTPVLEHRANPKRFLELQKAIFPNVANAAVCANAWRTFIEKVHFNCGTDGAQFFQTALWLFSPLPGNVGKSHCLARLRAALGRLGVEIGNASFTVAEGYLTPSAGMRTVTVCDETQFIPREIVPSLNLLIDQSDFGFNCKYGQAGMAHSYTNLVFASNDASSIIHTRRFMVVPYLADDVTKLSAGERKRYFPLWGDDRAVEDAMVEMFAVAPFASEHPGWEISVTNGGVANANAPSKITVPDRFADVLDDIKTVLKSKADTDEDLSSLRPSAFFKEMRERCGYDGYERKVAKSNLTDLLNILKSHRLLSYRGAANVFYAPIEWRVFDKVVAGVEIDEQIDADPLAATARQWDALIAAER